MAEISEYERERLSRIQDNQKFLQSLGLGGKRGGGGGGAPAKPAGIVAAIFKDDDELDSAASPPKKARKKKESKKPGDDFVPRRSSRSRTSTGSAEGQSNADALAALDEIEKNWNEHKHKKKNKDMGVRVVWGRTYDPINGTTCHQCRQKTLELKVTCTNIIEDYYGNKQICNVKLDEACLTNRYGQTIEAALASGEWKCPKCLGICNCSFCRRKKGLTPTGILIQKARAAGYESVDAYLRNGPPSAKKARRSKKSTATEPESTNASPSTPSASITSTPVTPNSASTSSPTDPTLTPLRLPLLFSPSLPSRDLLISPDGTPEFSMDALLSSSESDPYTDQLLFSDASTFSPPTITTGDKASTSGDNYVFPPFPPPPPGSDLSGYLIGDLGNDLTINLNGLNGELKLEKTEQSEKLPRAIRRTTTTKTENGDPDTANTTTTTTTTTKKEEPYGPDEFDVEKILDMKTEKSEDGKEEVFYLVQWRMFEPSWEPKDNLFCHSLVDSFLKKRNKGNRKSLDSPKQTSPKRKKRESIGNVKKEKKIKQEEEEEEEEDSQEATEDPSSTAVTSPSGSTKEKRANRGTRSSQLADFHFF